MSQTKATLLGDAFSTGASGSIPVGGIILWSKLLQKYCQFIWMGIM